MLLRHIDRFIKHRFQLRRSLIPRHFKSGQHMDMPNDLALDKASIKILAFFLAELLFDDGQKLPVDIAFEIHCVHARHGGRR